MATVYERTKLFYESHPNFKFGLHKYKWLHHEIKNHFDNLPDTQPYEYVEQVEKHRTFTVRFYPPSFTPTIDAAIHSLYEHTIKNLEHEKLRTKKKKKPLQPPKIRQRIPVKKPAYSSKPSTKTNGEALHWFGIMEKTTMV